MERTRHDEPGRTYRTGAAGALDMIGCRGRLLLGLLGACPGVAQAGAETICKPRLELTLENFAPAINHRRMWTAVVNADATRCRTTSGALTLGFSRQSAAGADWIFMHPFLWRSGQKKILIAFPVEDVVQRSWIADIAPCPCRGD